MLIELLSNVLSYEIKRNVVFVFYIHGSVHRCSILITSNEMQQYTGIYLLQITLHVSGVYRTHHQEHVKL